MASLRELQHAFAAALRDPDAACAVRPLPNLAVYRHNAAHLFRSALQISFPVLRRRVGDDYFRQLAHHYRQRHPSRSGDLHWVGAQFAPFLAQHLAGSEYAWLADLAALEWRCEMAVIAPLRPALSAEVLAGFRPEQFERLQFTLQPSLHLFESRYPVFGVWLANQVDNAPPLNQSGDFEAGMILQRNYGVEVRPLPPALFSYLSALARGDALGEAVGEAGLDEGSLLESLRFIFAESLVCAVQAAEK